ncbi:MAG TPA: PAS domain S-box protein [bacterium]|nr:PAS domain S-box protein [bacterium]
MPTSVQNPILLIEPDDETYRKMVDALEQSGYRIVRIVSGEEGLMQIPAIKPILIVCEFHTIDLDAKTIFNRFMENRSTRVYRHIPFVIFSEHKERTTYGPELFQKGLWGWFTKPFGDHELREVLENLLMVHGIMERNRELSREVKRSEFRYRDLLENANDFVFTLDQDGRFIYLNNRFTPLTGWSKDEWLGKMFQSLIDPDDRDMAVKHYDMAHQGKARIFEARILGRTEKNTILSFNITPFVDRRGTIIGSIGIARDVTESKQMEEEILELKNFNESIIQSMEAGLLTTDLNGCVTSLNAGGEKILGWKAREITGKPLKSFLGEEKADNLLSDPRRESLPFRREMELTSNEGKRIAIGFTSTARLDNQNKKAGTIISFRDISMIKQMQTEVIRMDRLASLGVVASGIAHEIKNPLAGIKTMAQACKDEFDPSDPRIEYLTRIVRQVNRLDDLLKTFFAYARPRPPDRKPHKLIEILREVTNLVGKKIDSSHVDYVEKISKTLMINADFQQMQQVFLNLILNALDAMPHGGTLSIKAQKDSSPYPEYSNSNKTLKEFHSENTYAKIEVIDSGVGIDPSRIETIFDPFVTTKTNGVGLGLSIVYRIIKEHDGDIFVQSRLDQGTRFIIVLPVGDKNGKSKAVNH